MLHTPTTQYPPKIAILTNPEGLLDTRGEGQPPKRASESPARRVAAATMASPGTSAPTLDALPPPLRAAAPVMRPAAMAAAVDLFGAARINGQPAMRIHIDEACGMPSDWRDWWKTYLNASRQQPSTRREARAVKNEAKYVADAYILHMLASSPYVVSDWRSADAHVVALLPRRYGGLVPATRTCAYSHTMLTFDRALRSAGIAAERCRRKLARESEAWRATGSASTLRGLLFSLRSVDSRTPRRCPSSRLQAARDIFSCSPPTAARAAIRARSPHIEIDSPPTL